MLNGEMQGALSELGARSWWSYKLPAALEARFAADSTGARARQLRIWCWITLGFVWLTVPLDIFSMPRMWPWFMSLRLLLMTPLFVASARRVGAGGSPALTLLLAVGPYCAIPATLPLMFALAPSFDPTLMVLVQFLNVLWITALVPLGLRGTLWFGGFAVVAGDAIIAGALSAHRVSLGRPDIVAVCHVMVVLMLLGKVLNERESRRSFVAGLRVQVHAESLARSNAQLLELSNTDALTGLANRRAFDQALAQRFSYAAASKSSIALLMIDIDFFKQFNDTAGHPEGDRCLATVAQAIGREIRGSDFAARYGGEEFVVILADADLAQASGLAERIRMAIAVLRVYHPGLGGGRFVSISIGIAAQRPESPGADGKALVVAADAALYTAKRAGRDRVVAADEPNPQPQRQRSPG